MASSQNIKTAVDAWIRETAGFTNKNYGVHRRLHLDGAAGSRRRTLIYLPNPITDKRATVLFARLRLRLSGTGWAGGPHTITVERISGTWSEGRVTWASDPAVTGTAITHAVTGGTDGQEIVIDLTAMFQTIVQSGAVFRGVKLSVNTAGLKQLHSSESENVGYRPLLELSWATPPDAPFDLRPSGGRQVSRSDPLLLWSFKDKDRADTQSAYHIVIATNPAVNEAGKLTTGIVLDTGFLNGTARQHLLASGTLVAGTTYYWQVKARDQDAYESVWSAVATFGMTSKGTLTLVNPAPLRTPTGLAAAVEASGSNFHTLGMKGYKVAAEHLFVKSAATAEVQAEITAANQQVRLTWNAVAGASRYAIYGRTAGGPWYRVADTADLSFVDVGNIVPDTARSAPTTGMARLESTTPLISSRLSAAQIAIEYEVQQASTVIWQRPKQVDVRAADTQVDFILPEGVMTKLADTPYTVIVRAWDAAAREGLPGDPPYYEARITGHVYDGDAAVATPNLVSATDMGDGMVEFIWTWGAADRVHPETFSLSLNGVDELRLPEPDECWEAFSGGTNRYRAFVPFPPNQLTAFRLRAHDASGGKIFVSIGTANQNLTTKVQGIWLLTYVEPRSYIPIHIRSKDTPDISIGEVSAVRQIIGSRRIVRLMDVVRGYEGSIDGVVIDEKPPSNNVLHNTFTSALTYAQRLEDMKGSANTRPQRLVLGHFNFPVTIGQISGPRPSRHPWLYEVGFEFSQEDEFTFVSVV